MFRYMVPLLTRRLPLYIPDLPGYGESTHSDPTTESSSKRSWSIDILTGLSIILNLPEGCPKQPIILVGHDRGGHLAHRLAVDFSHPTLQHSIHSHFNLLGVCLLDIVPALAQFEALSNPITAAEKFHRGFLAGPLAEEMMTAYGGGRFAEKMIWQWSGLSESDDDGDETGRRTRLVEGIAEYRTVFDRPEVIKAVCADYRAAAYVDAAEQVEDEKEGRRIEVDLLAVWSSKSFAGVDVKEVWRKWTNEEKAKVEGVEIGGEVGHFLCEEAPVETGEAVSMWVERLVKKWEGEGGA